MLELDAGGRAPVGDYSVRLDATLGVVIERAKG
jgi:hypothetical protein